MDDFFCYFNKLALRAKSQDHDPYTDSQNVKDTVYHHFKRIAINEAERSMRFSKVKEKVSGCFRTKRGAEEYVEIMS